VIPLSYAFSISGSIVTSWNLGFQIEVSGKPIFVGLFQTSGSGVGTFSGSGSMTTTVDSTGPLVVSAELTANVSGSGNVTFDVPHDSFDFNPSAAAAVPEPATLGLLGPALAAFGLLRRRARR